MKKLISILLLIGLLSNTAFADCDWSQIKANPDGTYTYNKTLHLCVGQMVQDDKVKDQQISDLTKAISLKDLAIQSSDARVALWQKSADDELGRLSAIEADQKKSEWTFFFLGVGTTFLAGIMAAKLVGR